MKPLDHEKPKMQAEEIHFISQRARIISVIRQEAEFIWIIKAIRQTISNNFNGCGRVYQALTSVGFSLPPEGRGVSMHPFSAPLQGIYFIGNIYQAQVCFGVGIAHKQ